MAKKIPETEFREIEEFSNFLIGTGRMEYLNKNPRGDKCICILRNFSALATQDELLPLQHLHSVDKNEGYKEYREHALTCKRCRVALDSMFLFEGLRNIKFFPQTIQKILEKESEYGLDKKVHLVKLPSPSSGTFSPVQGRLVYMTGIPLSGDKGAIELFYKRIKNPLEIKGFTDFNIHEKTRKYPSGRIRLKYFQANSHHKNPSEHAYVSVRSLDK